MRQRTNTFKINNVLKGLFRRGGGGGGGIKVEYHEVPLGHDPQEETNSLGPKGAREGIYPL